MADPTFDPTRTYVFLDHDGGATREDVGPEFWATIGVRSHEKRRLVCVFHLSEDASHWEVHPAGDELVFLLDGAVDLVLEEKDGERVVALRDRAATVVPRGTWHRVVVHSPSDALFVTPGAGSEQRGV